MPTTTKTTKTAAAPKATKTASASNGRTAPANGKAAPTKASATRTTKKTMKPSAAIEGTDQWSVTRVVQEMSVQADLAAMERRDRWEALVKEIEQRRQKVEQAWNALYGGGGKASRTMNHAVRESLDQLRVAVESAVSALR